MAAPSYAEFASLKYSAGGHAATRLVSQRMGAGIAWCGLRLGLSPNFITLIGLSIFTVTAALYASLPGGWLSLLTCLVLFQIGYGVDCADGQLARATGRTSEFGAWLDIACDYLRNILLGAALAVWFIRNGLSAPSALFVAALFSSGTAVQLHTVTALRQSSPTSRLKTVGAISSVRNAVTGVLDTATVLLLIALLRDLTWILAGYAATIGALYLTMAAFLAFRRLR